MKINKNIISIGQFLKKEPVTELAVGAGVGLLAIFILAQSGLSMGFSMSIGFNSSLIAGVLVANVRHAITEKEQKKEDPLHRHRSNEYDETLYLPKSNEKVVIIC